MSLKTRCPVCAHAVTLLPGGRIRRHRDWRRVPWDDTAAADTSTCPASGLALSPPQRKESPR
jgi:hypothetical protein